MALSDRPNAVRNASDQRERVLAHHLAAHVEHEEENVVRRGNAEIGFRHGFDFAQLHARQNFMDRQRHALPERIRHESSRRPDRIEQRRELDPFFRNRIEFPRPIGDAVNPGAAEQTAPLVGDGEIRLGRDVDDGDRENFQAQKGRAIFHVETGKRGNIAARNAELARFPARVW